MAKWSKIWTEAENRYRRDFQLEMARYTPPASTWAKKGGKYPHLQPFFKNRKV